MTIVNSIDSTSMWRAATGGGVGAAVALVATFLLVPVSVRIARKLGILDEPGARSSHHVATARLGGIAVGIGAIAGLVAAALVDPDAMRALTATGPRLGLVLGASALLFGGVGLADDLLRGIPVSTRLLGQALIGAALVWPAVLGDPLGDEFAAPRLAVAVAAAIWAIGYINAFNFMDGVDGMSGLVAIVVGIDLAIVGALDHHGVLVVAGLVLAGAAGGFLPANLRPATVFLGDGGSYFLGAWIATAIIFGLALGTPPEAVLAVTVPYFADVATTLVRRVARGDDWRTSHHEHAYQQLVELGASHRSVALGVAGASALCAALGLLSLQVGPLARSAAAIAIVGVGMAYVASPAARRRRLAAQDQAPAGASIP